MRTSNLPSGALRVAEAGLVWEERLTGVGGTLEISPYSIFRVHALAGLTVTVDGKLAMTMVADEVERFNTGDGKPDDTKITVTVVVSGACNLQVAREVERRRS